MHTCRTKVGKRKSPHKEILQFHLRRERERVEPRGRPLRRGRERLDDRRRPQRKLCPSGRYQPSCAEKMRGHYVAHGAEEGRVYGCSGERDSFKPTA